MNITVIGNLEYVTSIVPLEVRSTLEEEALRTAKRNFPEWAKLKNFANINFRESMLVKDFASINFHESLKVNLKNFKA